ncbi:uncharacterized protein MELLADRAFT_107285 [Melampsora larici-populina 98AG31]|uniref:Uncharacterized protein n=1 Tax=Melampsora larici-populina (strain 98AG31 / pathotype 3-4-7) TaxID=747676 RepID=F4RNU0_MELLP|nr:uncharacterized protein MELLADRAFT_107285 [Melampsora larici-populina 98AG31]EGG05853.1 hypothetical protein MELLADRAFT_107285 [Melampsora larici-populina 98AG31]
MQNYDRHIKCPSHLDAVAHHVADQDQQHAEHLMNLDPAIERSPSLAQDEDEMIADHQSDRAASPHPPQSQLLFERPPDGDDPLGLFDDSDVEPDSDQEFDFIRLQQAFEELLGGETTDSEEDPDVDEDDHAGGADTAGEWYPFKSIELILMINLIARSWCPHDRLAPQPAFTDRLSPFTHNLHPAGCEPPGLEYVEDCLQKN